MMRPVQLTPPKVSKSVNKLLKEKKQFTRHDTDIFLKSTLHLGRLETQSHSKTHEIATESRAIITKRSVTQQTPKKSEEKIETPHKILNTYSPPRKRLITDISGSDTATSTAFKMTSSSRFSIRKNLLGLLPGAVNMPVERINTQISQADEREFLLHDTKILVTAKRWAIFDLESEKMIKGFKAKVEHEIASLTKIMTFYCAYLVVAKYCLLAEKFELIVDRLAEGLKGTTTSLMRDEMLTLQDLLYGMMLNSGNDAAQTIAMNLGALIRSKNKGEYFSPFDFAKSKETKQTLLLKSQSMAIFVALMNSAAKELGLSQTKFFNCHGMTNNTSTTKDLAKLCFECLKIPLFQKIVKTESRIIKTKFIDSSGEVEYREILLTNTNKLLAKRGYKGIKTGTSMRAGGCLVSLYESEEHKLVVVVLGCSGKDAKFSDTQKIVDWYIKCSQMTQP